MEERKINRLTTTDLIGPMVDEHWRTLREANEKGEPTAWCAGPIYHLTGAMDIPTHFMAGYASYVAGRKWIDPLFEAADEDGYLPDTCSYHRCHMGMLSLKRRGLQVKEEVSLPIPDIVMCSRICPEQSHYTDCLYREYGTTPIPIDIPVMAREEDVEDAALYLERQLKEIAVPAVEKLCGRPFDYEALSRQLAVLKETAKVRKECLDMAKHIPSPWTFVDICVSIAPVMYLFGKPGTFEFYQKLKAELEDRVAQGIGALPGERYRIYWDAFMLWRYLGVLTRKLTSFGAVLLAGRYPFGLWPYAEEIDTENPIRTLAREYTAVYWRVNHGWLGTADYIIEDFIKPYHIDGAIILSPRTCRLWGIGQGVTCDEIERRTGIPTFLLEADMVDPKFFSEAQFDTRFQAFCERMEAQKAKRR